MYQIQHLKNRLADVQNVRSVAKLSGISEKTIHRIRGGESDTTFGTANRIIAAIDVLYPLAKVRKQAKPRTVEA